MIPFKISYWANIVFLRWLAPISSANKAVATNFTLGELNPLPWAMMLGNCVGWVAYSFIVKDYWPLGKLSLFSH